MAIIGLSAKVSYGRWIAPLATAALSAASVHATTFTPLTGQQVLQQFNLVVLGDGQTNSHVDGRVYVAGSFTSGDLVQKGTAPASNYAAVTVGKDLTGSKVNNGGLAGVGAVVLGSANGITVQNGGAAVMGNSTDSTYNGGSTFIGGTRTGGNFNSTVVSPLSSNTSLSNVVDAAKSTDFGAVMGGLSTQLKGLTTTGSTAARNGNVTTFTAKADANGVAVFDLGTDANLLSAGEFSFVLNGAKTLIFNSALSNSIGINANFLNSSAIDIGSKAVWNFYNATSISLGAQFGGSILATHASLTNTNNIEGAVVVSSYDGKGEVHLQSFTGSLPGPGGSGGGSQQVPEPGSLALVVAAAGAAAVARRRQRHAA